MSRIGRALVGVALLSGFGTISSRATAEEACARITRASLVRCALAASLASRAERQGGEIAEARAVAASPFFPSNPVLSASVSRRTIVDRDVANWNFSLSQELEIGGQRGARRTAAEADVAAQRSRIVATDREIAADAWVAYYDAIAAEESTRLATRLEAVARSGAVAARARAEKGLIPMIDADVAEAAAIRATQVRIDAQQRAGFGRALLASRLGLDPIASAVTIEGDLSPLPGIDTAARAALARTLDARPEVQALEAERRAADARAAMYRRSRVPNMTVLAWVQNDDLNDRVIGIGVGVPIPLPQPVGRTYAGEIAEAEATSRRAASLADRARRELRLQLVGALSVYDAKRTAADAYAADRIARAEQSLASIAQEIEAGRLAVRDAVVSQQTLMDLLQARLEAQRALCIASVDLARAAGVPLEQQTR